MHESEAPKHDNLISFTKGSETLKSSNAKSSMQEKLQEYRMTLKNMERYIDTTDRRELTIDSIDVLEKDLRVIIVEMRDLQSPQVRNWVISLEAIRANLRRAQTELYVASDILKGKGKSRESSSRSFYKCLSNFEEYLSAALQNFK